MRRKVLIFILAIMPTLMSAQSIIVTRSLEMLPNSQAVIMFNNIFGQYENNDVDDSFPYVVVQMNLTGDVNAIRAAKQNISLELGTMYKVEATDKNQQNKILFLVPKGARNIYVLCGDGCEKQLLHSGVLIENKVYNCTVEYTPVKVQGAASSNDVDALRKQVEDMQKLLRQMSDNQQNNAKENEEKSVIAVRNQEIDQKFEPDNKVETITVNGVSFNMRMVEGGTFMMGCDNCKSNEQPRHRVTLSDFYIGETVVTQELWTAVMGKNPSLRKREHLPVTNVSWYDCQAFIEKLNELTGRKFALPTEAQWEYAARGGNRSRNYIYAGSNNLDEVAWYVSNIVHNYVNAVALKKPNELGLYDMQGNVDEWCYDWYDKKYYSVSPSIDPTGPSEGKLRVLRGGSWETVKDYFSLSYRIGDFPKIKYMSYGFRLVMLP